MRGVFRKTLCIEDSGMFPFKLLESRPPSNFTSRNTRAQSDFASHSIVLV